MARPNDQRNFEMLDKFFFVSHFDWTMHSKSIYQMESKPTELNETACKTIEAEVSIQSNFDD